MAKKKQQPSFAQEKVDWAINVLYNSSKDRDRFFQKLDQYQKYYLENIYSKSVVFVDAKAGTGKTTIAVLAGLELLRQGKVSRVVYVRFPDKRYAKLGFLTGCKEEKEEILMNPFYEAAAECGMQPEAVNRLAEKGFIEATTDIGMRGRNLKTSFVIIDEAQNGTIDDLKLLLTRIHDRDCKATVIGHSGQCDNPPKLYAGKYNAFQVYQIHMTKKPWAVKCDLPNNYRGEISQHADNVDETIKELEQIMLTNTQ